jgi:hypothetical protein
VKLGYGRVVSEENVYYLGHLAAKATFPKDANKLFTDPSKLPPPQPQPDPDMIKLELQDKWKQMADVQKREKMGVDAQLEQMRQQLEAGKFAAEQSEKERDRQIDMLKSALEEERADRERIMDAMTQIRIAQEQGRADQETTVLQGVVDSQLETQRHEHAKVEKVIEGQVDIAKEKAKPKPKPTKPK